MDPCHFWPRNALCRPGGNGWFTCSVPCQRFEQAGFVCHGRHAARRVDSDEAERRVLPRVCAWTCRVERGRDARTAALRCRFSRRSRRSRRGTATCDTCSAALRARRLRHVLVLDDSIRWRIWCRHDPVRRLDSPEVELCCAVPGQSVDLAHGAAGSLSFLHHTLAEVFQDSRGRVSCFVGSCRVSRTLFPPTLFHSAPAGRCAVLRHWRGLAGTAPALFCAPWCGSHCCGGCLPDSRWHVCPE